MGWTQRPEGISHAEGCVIISFSCIAEVEGQRPQLIRSYSCFCRHFSLTSRHLHGLQLSDLLQVASHIFDSRMTLVLRVFRLTPSIDMVLGSLPFASCCSSINRNMNKENRPPTTPSHQFPLKFPHLLFVASSPPNWRAKSQRRTEGQGSCRRCARLGRSWRRTSSRASRQGGGAWRGGWVGVGGELGKNKEKTRGKHGGDTRKPLKTQRSTWGNGTLTVEVEGKERIVT